MNEDIKNKENIEQQQEDVQEDAQENAQEENVQSEKSEREYTETEKKAIDMGWQPDREVENPDDYKTAGEFVRNASFIERIDDQKSIISKLEFAVKRVGKMIENQNKTSQKERATQFQEQKREAIRMGDVEGAEKFEHAYNEVQNSIPSQQETEKQEVDAFKQRNSDWMNDYEMSADANNYSVFLETKNPGISGSDLLTETERFVRNKYFNKAKDNQDKASAITITAPENSSTAKRSKKNRYEDLTESQKRVYRTIKSVDPDINLTPDEYAQQAEEFGTKQPKRR